MTDAKKQSENLVAVDEQTGRAFRVEQEDWHDIVFAWLSILYLVGMLFLFSWGLLQVWIGHFPFLEKILGQEKARLSSTLFRLMAYTAIGGGLGAIANGIRSFMYWHLDNRGFGGRFFWKYFSLPPLGALLAVMVYAAIRAGLGAFSGNAMPAEGLPQSMSAFGLGALAGYGSHQVFVWLDDKVSKLFKVSAEPGTKVPDLKGKTQAEAEVILKTADLTLGKVDTIISDDPTKEGKVDDQTPASALPIATKGVVNIKIATPGVKVPDLKGKTQAEAETILKETDLALGKVDPATSDDPAKEGKIIKQNPASEALVARKGAVDITIATKGA